MSYLAMEYIRAQLPFAVGDPMTAFCCNKAGGYAEDQEVTTHPIAGPVADTQQADSVFDGITYSKGASVLAMISTFMGPEHFQAGIREYLRDHARGNATTADLVAALTRAPRNPNVAPILESFTTQAGIPSIEFGAVECGEDEGHPFARVPVRQTRYRPLDSSAEVSATWTVPVCVTHADRGGVIQESCTLLTAAQGVLEMPTCPAWLWPNPSDDTMRVIHRFQELVEVVSLSAYDRNADFTTSKSMSRPARVASWMVLEAITQQLTSQHQ